MSAERIEGSDAWVRIDRALRECAIGRRSPAEVCEFGYELQELVDSGAHCCCDEVRGCPRCFDRADELVGRRVRDSYGREWAVLDTGEKDGFPTICGETWWARPDDVEVVGHRVGGRSAA